MTESGLYALMLRTAGSMGPTIERALAAGVVLDTWMNGQAEEHITPEAERVLDAATQEWARRAQAARAVFPTYPMPPVYVEAVFNDLLTGTALYVAQQATGTRTVSAAHAGTAVRRLAAFVAAEPDGITAAARYHAVVASHEDLNAVAYYGRMRREDFLWGTLHRPWLDRLLTPEWTVYTQAGVLRTVVDGEGEWVTLTPAGRALLDQLRRTLEAAGEFAWRANAQRWVIFGETDYDRVFDTVFPDSSSSTREWVARLPLPPGAQVLEIGAGTGRVTFELGLADRVAAVGGQLIALEPSAALLSTLKAKRAQRGADHVTLVQGVAEAIPYPADRFDLVLAVAVLHFTEVEQAVAEMTRVTRPEEQAMVASSSVITGRKPPEPAP
ncbi:MAG: class I SAM-dependent methyltransferase [Firmicutes bacterium]|nr:class I SAM-dependent methyltransferase [Bacillota bacterium]